MLTKYLDFTEIRTKITSLFPFFMSLAYLFYKGQKIRVLPMIVFFASMFVFDLTTTAINNYIDTKSNGETIPFQRATAKKIIFVMLGISVALGLWLVYLTDVVILLIGMLCFGCGIIYTYGPVAISRIPLGEVLSGIFYGFFIPFIILYINMPEGYFLQIAVESSYLVVHIHYVHMGLLILFSMVPTLTTANIMLANNTSDVEKDVKNNRYTLPYYIGKKKATSLYGMLYMVSYLSAFFLVFLKELPLTVLLMAITLGQVRKNIEIFKKKQVKSETFITSIKNFVLLNGSMTLSIILGGLLDKN